MGGDKIYKYELIIFWSGEDQSYVVEVPELSRCMADGKTYEEAVKNDQIVISEWIDTARNVGREILRPKGRLTYA
jgi:predicted RNase H-like HicB family nuclease